MWIVTGAISHVQALDCVKSWIQLDSVIIAEPNGRVNVPVGRAGRLVGSADIAVASKVVVTVKVLLDALIMFSRQLGSRMMVCTYGMLLYGAFFARMIPSTVPRITMKSIITAITKTMT